MRRAPSLPRALLPDTDGVVASVRALVRASPPGRIFSPPDFVGSGPRAAVDQALSRLARRGELRRIARGLYERPRRHPVLGPLLPSIDAIARAIAARHHLRIQPAGAYAANLLGLTEQVPMRTVFLTDGASRIVTVGKQQIVLRHTTPRTMATAGRVSGLVIQALRHFRRPNVDKRVVDVLRRRFSKRDRALLCADAPLAPTWIAEILRDIGRGTD